MTQKNTVTPGDFNKHPLWFRSLNAIWEKRSRFGTGFLLQKDELIQRARKTTGLHDFGDFPWEEALEKLLYSLNHEARLHPIGRFISMKRMVNLLAIRLRAEFWFKKYPHILEQEIYPPLVIVGLQRTGTTKLHRLLTADPDNRVLRSWEALNPAPLKQNLNGRDRRVQYARTSEKALKWMASGFFAIHPVEFTAPEEDILLLDVSFLSTTPEATTHVPSYASWLEQTDQSASYEYGSRLLRLLQWQHPGKRWVLKSPHHLEFLPLLEKYYGNPHFLWTHRNISECIPSFLSMVCHSHSIFSDQVDIREITAHWVNKTSYMLNQALSYRLKPGNQDKFTDIRYEALVAEAMEEMENIYRRLDGMDPSLQQLVRRAEVENPKGKYGIHDYDPAFFGLAGEELEKLNQAYVSLYNKL